MKILFVILITLGFAAPALAQNKTLDYYKCVESNAVSLGKNNKESADIVLRAAYSECSFEQKIAVLEIVKEKAESGIMPRVADMDRKGKTLRQDAGDIAIAALLKARAK